MRPLLSLFLVSLFMVMCSPKEQASITVDSIRLSNSTVSLVKGQKITLQAEVLPLNSEQQKLSWYSTDNSIASVDNGTVVGNELGEATITVKSGRVWSNCLVRVVAQKIPVESITSEVKELSLVVDGEVRLSYSLTPENTTDLISWSSSDEDVARVVDGTVFARAVGTTVITATVGNKSVSWTVHVKLTAPKITRLDVSPDKLDMEVGDVRLLDVELGSDRPEDVNIDWSSDNESVISVLNGRLTAKKVGNATVTAKAGDLEAKCAVTVSEKSSEIKVLRLDKSNIQLRVDQTITLRVHVIPEDALGKLEWSSSDEKVATVSRYGFVKAIAEGKADITVKVGNRSVVCNLEVVSGLQADDFIIEVSDISSLDGLVSLTPPSDDVTFVFDIFSKARYDRIVETSGGVINHSLAFWEQFGDADFLASLKTGPQKMRVSDPGSNAPFPGMSYVATCFGIDKNKNITSPLKVVKFKLNGSTPSSNKLSFKETGVTTTALLGEILTTNNDGYYITIQTRKYVDFYKNKEQNNPNELIEGLSPVNYMIYRAFEADLKDRKLDDLILHGNTKLTDGYFAPKRPGREYVLVIVGLNKDQGLCTTPVYHYFTTKSNY
ncbi:Ig-like domain-containing protein [Porphyromonas sp.]|uniref:Ig-like domain-containing protein n=1 Tax=Porphyromonas sp. TaxID=1924944 RepID=UPI0026DAA8FD|nr:Ig-like domain-containing protein [Porphyromonas sp.]MDO4770947.1 Ig-like domain-containing protein [Porphyromonas sp.]